MLSVLIILLNPPIIKPPLVKRILNYLELYQNIVKNIGLWAIIFRLRRLITKAIILIIAQYTSKFSPAAPNYKGNYH